MAARELCALEIDGADIMGLFHAVGEKERVFNSQGREKLGCADETTLEIWVKSGVPLPAKIEVVWHEIFHLITAYAGHRVGEKIIRAITHGFIGFVMANTLFLQRLMDLAEHRLECLGISKLYVDGLPYEVREIEEVIWDDSSCCSCVDDSEKFFALREDMPLANKLHSLCYALFRLIGIHSGHDIKKSVTTALSYGFFQVALANPRLIGHLLDLAKTTEAERLSNS